MSGQNDVDISVAIAVPRYQNSDKFLAVKRSDDREHSPGLWEFPSGKIEEGEIPEEAALRELEEETGLEGELKGVCDFHERTIGGDRVRFYPYLVEVEFKDEVELSDEHSEFEWIQRSEASDLYRQDNFENVLDSVKEVQGDVAVAVVYDNREFLILRRSERESFSGSWEFPGGEVEEEMPSGSSLRELKEETGLEAKIVEKGHPYIDEGSTGFWRLYPFLIEVTNLDRQEISLSEEHDEYKWVKFDELENLETMGHMKSLKSLGLI